MTVQATDEAVLVLANQVAMLTARLEHSRELARLVLRAAETADTGEDEIGDKTYTDEMVELAAEIQW